MNLPVTLRRATPADAARLLEIENLSFVTDQIKPRQMRYLISRASAVTLVAEVGEQIVGYLLVLVPKSPRPARIYSVAVAPVYRGQNVAQQLLRFALGYLRSLQYAVVRLEVRAGDQRAQTLYRRLGFSPVSRLAQYYADGEAAVRMQLNLEVPHPSE
ncbi:N-acetyltransferase family protein [Pontibacter sp. JAM-7]|uniref:GNAT family N-acetyltransferase n=1 Tax=Pontibacter sp. JAM-7 TaxID=3366581 RepID=UPI003AF54A33